jgi:hypothetical protein
MDHYLGKEMVQVRAQRTIRSVQRATNNMLQPSICNVATINLQRVVLCCTIGSLLPWACRT